MALRDLVEGECGGSNSLVRLTSHFTADHALKDEGLRHAFPRHGETFSESDQFVHEFLQQTIGNSTDTFHMDTLLQEMRDIEHAGIAPRPAPGVAQLAADPNNDPQEWSHQFLDVKKHFEDPLGIAQNIWAVSENPSVLPIGAERESGSGSGGLSELGFGPNWAQEYLESNDQNSDVKPDELATLVDPSQWISELTDKDESADAEVQKKAEELVKAIDDSKFTHSKFMKFMRQVANEESALGDKEKEANKDASSSWANEFAGAGSGVWDEYPTTSGLQSTWEQEFQKKYGNVDSRQAGDGLEIEDVDNPYSSQFWDKLQEQWSKMEQDHKWLSDFNEYTDPFKEYTFEKENPMASNDDPFEEGKKRLEQGDIPSAVLCFEAACQASPENALAWQYLGTTQAENEQDPLAIAALKKCLAQDPENMVALMALAVSFTNENYQNQACHALKEWLRANPKYSDLVPANAENLSHTLGATSSLMPDGAHQNVQDLYIQAARRNPSGTIDPDVQCGLGVLFNLSNEYDKAVDCFKAALEVRQDDFRMWNRLGATLANGSRSEEAVDAYHNALHLFPGFIRARYNLGITCVNLGAHKEAAEHFLTALNQQAAGRGAKGERVSQINASMSDSIWSTLRLVLGLLERQDLYPYLENRDLERLNQEFNMD